MRADSYLAEHGYAMSRERAKKLIAAGAVVIDGKMLKICSVKVERADGENDVAGEVLELDSVGDGAITVACGVGRLLVTKLKPEGKGVMSAGDFIRGRKIKKGDVLK